jgi:hypothetical protein
LNPKFASALAARYVRTSGSGHWQAYVILPAGHGGGALYYLWRPLSYVDGSLTGMRFHIGPHR